MSVTPTEFVERYRFTADNYPERDCNAANAELLRLASDPRNARYLETTEWGELVLDGRRLCDLANDNI